MRSKLYEQVSILIGGLLCLFFFCGMICLPVRAEGSINLNPTGSTGYRAYTERYGSETAGESRKTKIFAYIEQGETVYFGTSVKGSKLGYTAAELGVDSATLAKVNSSDIMVVSPNADGTAFTGDDKPYISGAKNPNVELFDVDNDAVIGQQAEGYLSTRTMETIGPSQITSGGYNGFHFTATQTGIYEFKFYSKALTSNNPKMVKVDSETAFTPNAQNGGTVAAWDITIQKADNSVPKGRIFTKELFVNMGGNQSSQSVLEATMYAVTNDGYQYSIDFNGMDPYGFVFFANNRGLLAAENASETPSLTNTQSLYHSVRSQNNQLSDLKDHNIILNNTPTVAGVDQTYNLFFNKPADETLTALQIPTDPAAADANGVDPSITYTGATGGDGYSYTGKGGTFSFSYQPPTGVSPATSYEIILDFGNGNQRILSNALQIGENSIKWDGKDANGNTVPSGTYGQNAKLLIKGGEIHFPLMDVEDNINGIIIERLNGAFDADKNLATKVYFNSSANDAGDTTAPWSISNWIVGSKTDATNGVDSADGAMKYKGRAGDQCALDIWARYSTQAQTQFQFEVKSLTSCTVTKKWVNNSGTQPASIDVQLYKGGTLVDGSDQTLSDANSWTYTWTDLVPGAAYTVKEKTVPDNYNAGYENSGNASSGYQTVITNTYVPPVKTMKVVKDWKNDTEADRPDALPVHLIDTSETPDATRTESLTKDTQWSYEWDNLTDSHFYKVEEDVPTGYEQTGYRIEATKTSTNEQYLTITLTNTLIPTTSMTVTKNWQDYTGATINAPDGASVQMQLVKDGASEGNAVTLDASSGWTYTWDDLSMDSHYSVQEVSSTATDYAVSYEDPAWDEEAQTWSQTITNKAPLPPTTSVTAYKNWEIDEDTPDVVPDEGVTFNLYQDDSPTPYDSCVVTRGARWAHTWSDLPYGHQWKVTENAVNGFQTTYGTVEGSDTSGYETTVTNTYIKPLASCKLTLFKELKGATLAKDAFEFVLTDQEGNEIQRAKNQADGFIVFDKIKDLVPGTTYIFHVTEVAGNDKNITYDSTTKEAVVEVNLVDPANNTCVCTINWNTNSMFVNTYTGPDSNKPADSSHKSNVTTGDYNTSIFLYFSLSLISLVTIISSIVIRYKRK